MKGLFHYIVLHCSIPSSTCLSSSMVLEFPLPLLQLFYSLGIKMTFNTVQGSSPHKCGQESSCDAFNAVVAAFSQDISASLSLPYALVIYLYLWNFLEGGLRESRGSSHHQTSCPRRVFLSDQPIWILTRSTISYNGPLWFLLLGRIVDETSFLGLDHGPIFYSPTVLIEFEIYNNFENCLTVGANTRNVFFVLNNFLINLFKGNLVNF